MSYDGTTIDNFSSPQWNSSGGLSSNRIRLEATYENFVAAKTTTLLQNISKYTVVKTLMAVIFAFSVHQIYSFLTGDTFFVHPLLSLMLMVGGFFVWLTAMLASRGH